MCNMNALCPIKEGPCSCITKLQIQFIPMINEDFNNPFMLNRLIRIMDQQVEELKQISEIAKKVLDTITNSKKIISDQSDSPIVNSGELCSRGGILRFLRFNLTPHSLNIQFTDMPPNPAYKDRCFSFSVFIADQENKKIFLQEKLFLKIMLFTCQTPIQPLKMSTSGDQILLGNIQTEGNSDFHFKKVIIKEVSSRFLHGNFFFVIAPQNAEFIRPLIMKDFIVKSRKCPHDLIDKHMKIDDGTIDD
ncbi:hypothetical protein SteCoe_2866 [Stentor coeruleus]|uniref:Uncharacterized protein n=1 Tax=Stentor coeruleus TaxID=5963 RepID=A0A1R2CYK6_9CILI|nr:hypothetical protein SteCoe_2866 [Stentor coeruleus]